MLRNFLKITWRNLVSNKGFSIINIVGLTLGFSFALLIGLWVQDEWSYNRFHNDLDQLYRVKTHLHWGSTSTSGNTPGLLAKTLKSEFPEIEQATIVKTKRDQLFYLEDQNFKSSGINVHSDFFQMFSFPMLKGDPDNPFKGPNSIVITKSLAQRIFGTVDVEGEVLKSIGDQLWEVSGVIQDPPTNSSIQFEWISPWETWLKTHDWAERWGNISFPTYVRTTKNVDLAALNEKIRFAGEAKDNAIEFFLQPIADIHLYNEFTDGLLTGGRIEYVRIFAALAIFIIIIACINFMNLATARSAKRAKEIGVRKVLGTSRRGLVFQFIGEAIILSMLAILLALILTHYALGLFNNLFQKEIVIDYSDPILWISIVSLTLTAGILAGSYPALFLSSFRPSVVLKGAVNKIGDGSIWIRKGLVVFQFMISILLIISTLVIQKQIHFIKNKNLGLDRKDMFYTVLDGGLYANMYTFKEELLASSAIKNVTTTTDNPLSIGGTSGDLDWEGKDPEGAYTTGVITVSEDFIATMGLELLEGRDFSKDHPADTANYIINESAAEMMGMQDPLGKKISFWNGEGQIIGVLKDYHMESLHVPIRPLVLVYTPVNTWIAWIKPNDGQTEEAIAHVKTITEKMNPGFPFEYTFADDEFERQYQNETLTGHLINIFAAIAILISALGLLGLASYSAERRRKEIGIRKVLGATATNIIELLFSEFFILVLIALLIAIPLSWGIMNQWLSDFAYSIDIEWWIFIVAAIAAIGIAFLTVITQALRAAWANPIHSIRTE